MLHISRRGKEMPASPIRKLVPYAEAAKQRGVKIYHLNIGQPDIETPKEALEAVRGMEIKVLEYSHSAGNESYRRGLTDYYQTFGIDLSHEEILVTAGGSEAILFGMMSCLDEGDEVIIPEPLYANYNGFTRAGGIVVRPITSTIESGFALPSAADFEVVINERTKAILICNPSNPTGYLYSSRELQLLGDIVKRHDLFLFSDEVYREFCYDGAVYTSVMNIEGLEQHAIVIDSISKRYSACGARIGALVTKNREVLDAAIKFAQARLSPPGLGQIMAEATLGVPASYFEGVKEEYTRRRNLLVSRLQGMEGVVCPNPGGAFYTFVKLPIEDSDHFCQWMLEEFEYNGETVMMAPGTGFYSTAGRGKDEVRLAYVLNEEDLSRAMDCLEVALQVYPRRKA